MGSVRCILAGMLALLMAWPAAALDVIGVQIDGGSSETVTLTLSEPAPYKTFLVDSPPRAVIDLPPFQWKVPATTLSDYRGRLIQNIRYARFDDKTSRVVFDLGESVELQPAGKGQGLSIRFTLQPKVASVAEPKPYLSSQPPPTRSVGRQESGLRVVPLPRVKPSTSQPLIAIDAGHGGQDPGTLGERDTKEKRVTLAYAQALARALNATGRFRTTLTRSDDRFILLRDRIAIARKAGADLFLSLHADSAPTLLARGLSVYTLSQDASDKEAALLAARENKADVLGGMDLSTQDADVAGILIDLAQRDTKNKSIRMADLLVAELRSRVKLLTNPHRYAGFAVLKAPDIPSALVEIGFLSHPEEERLINSAAHRGKVVAGLVEGIEAFFATR